MNKKRVLKNKADRAWYLKCLKPKCEVCGSPAQQTHHYFYKASYGHLRYDLENGISLCNKCHFLLHHRDPKTIEDRIIEKRGQKWLKELKKRAYQRPLGSYLTVGYYQNIIEGLKPALK